VLGDAAPGLDEDYPAELAAVARELAVDGAVEFAGHVAEPMRGIDVLVHAAELEPFGLVMVEAMLAGLPVVAPREGGPVEIVRDGVDGLLVDVTDAGAVAAAVLSLVGDPALRARMGAAGRERALERFTAERMARENWELVARVASGRYARSA
jgi:glycosyltransferase involved in cell wall biosynthesis